MRSALGQPRAHSFAQAQLSKKAHVSMLPERYWDLGLQVLVRKKLLFPQDYKWMLSPQGLSMFCPMAFLWAEPRRSCVLLLRNQGTAQTPLGDPVQGHLWAGGKVGPPVPQRMAGEG